METDTYKDIEFENGISTDRQMDSQRERERERERFNQRVTGTVAHT